VKQLREAGFEAVWAGGCVRDQLLGKRPKDYDVATSARPEQVRELFGRRRTLAIGAAFGVIAVLAPRREAGQIEVATFRSDAAYSDGRHPDSVTFSTAEHDAQRRDFTINGLFYDPLAERTIDYVGGVADLERSVVRAIGDPFARIAEDKLRMLRAVRFAATFEFALDDATLAAVQQQAHELVIVSAERVAAELKRMLVHKHRVRAVTLLRESGLLEVVLPEAKSLYEFTRDDDPDSPWNRTLAVLRKLKKPSFPTALAALMREICQSAESPPADGGIGLAEEICRRWRLSNDEIAGVAWLLLHHATIRSAHATPWPALQRILVAPRVDALLAFSEAVASVLDEGIAAIDFCRTKLALPREVLDPPPLLTGDDLKQAGIPPGPEFKRLLEAIRDAQLEGRVSDKPGAIDFALERSK
jgi:tRNA nucleotidyltransferase/poly(A) polymerase